jgi:type III secretion protein W
MAERFSSEPTQQVRSGDALRAQQAAEKQRMAQYAIALDSAIDEFKDWGDTTVWNPLALSRNFQPLERRVRDRGRADETTKSHETDKEEEALDEVVPIEKIEEVSEQFHKKNHELQQRVLLLLRSKLSVKDTSEDVLKKVREFYTDATLADEALDFLIETSRGRIQDVVRQAKEKLNSSFEKEIKAGKNILSQTHEFAAKGIGAPTSLRDLYRDITGNPREAATLFDELASNYSFDKLKTVINFILHALGADMKSKGPSISRAELSRLFTETKNMQAILGVFRFFLSRIRMMTTSFGREGLDFPQKITFESLAKAFMRFLQERYPSVDKALQISSQFDLSEEVPGQIILYIQFRDAMRQVSLKLFKDERQRQEFLLCFMDTLEELEEQLEEEIEEEEKKEKQKKKNGES